MALDLYSLGRELRERRRMLRIPSAELARRIGVSQTYVWMIESAAPRKNGQPSRPSEDVLGQWARALGMGPVDTERLLALAGYFVTASESPAPPSPAAARLPRSAAFHAAEASAYAPAPMAVPPVPNRDNAEPEERDLRERLETLLRTAARRGRAEEIAGLVRSHLGWLQHLIEDEGTSER
jgi:transcriptional regulator with XRE-family HTH domain